jgi:hypothetical protein
LDIKNKILGLNNHLTLDTKEDMASVFEKQKKNTIKLGKFIGRFWI